MQLARAGVFDLRIFHDEVLMPILRHWHIFELEGLAAEAEAARQHLATWLQDLDANARRFEERRDATAWSGQGRSLVAEPPAHWPGSPKPRRGPGPLRETSAAASGLPAMARKSTLRLLGSRVSEDGTVAGNEQFVDTLAGFALFADLGSAGTGARRPLRGGSLVPGRHPHHPRRPAWLRAAHHPGG